MEKLLLSVSFLSLSLLLVFGINAPNDPIIWLASTSQNFAAIRIILMAVLVILLVASSYMNAGVRTVLGILAVILVGYTLKATFTDEIKLEDTLTLLMAGVSASIVALEPISKVEDYYVRTTRVTGGVSTRKAHLAPSH